MGEAIETLYVTFTAMITADLKNLLLVQQLYQLSIYRLSEEMCTFAHGYIFSVVTQR